MATLALSAAGAAAGGALLPGVSLLGGALSGAAIGRAAGAIAGGYIDQVLLGGSGQHSVRGGPRLSDLRVTASTEGADIPRLYGRARVGGQVIWATAFEEETVKSGGGGKGTAGATASGKSYRYYANFAVGLCEGPITRIGRVWADGKEIELAQFVHRVYPGDEEQLPDGLIELKQGAGKAPAYRGLAYVVFERMPLKEFGNRLPQLNFEVFRAVDSLENDIRAVTMIPAAGEFAYEPATVLREIGTGRYVNENKQTYEADSNIVASLDHLQQALPACAKVALFVSWFGDDLRAGHCTIRPKVDLASKKTTPYSWSSAGLTRSAAQVVSDHDGRPAFGGTPADASVINAIKEMASRGLAVTLTPFLLMDVPAGNSLPDPYSDGAATIGQPVYPWRGRITCSPAPGFSGSPDKTATAATQVSAFVGTVTAAHFSVSGETVTYTGPAEWSYSRFILHNAALAKAAGGVDAFVIGSEMRGLTWVRESASSYPFVTALKNLAAEVSTLLPSAKITYAADWSEYFGHQPTDGSNDVYFHLDPLWSDANIDAIGIDNYWPLSDWRDGTAHADYVAGWRSPTDQAYLQANIAGGEGYDWYYASSADRDSQTRTPITDGAYSKPWVFRYKDIKSWWENQHYNRPGGVESGTPTAWVPESKPIWFMELGCPAVDRGSNQPNVFYDPKSSESFLPYYSRGVRDDAQQRAHIKAVLDWYDPASPSFTASRNPESGVYTGRMVDLARIYVYTWDARPYPAFPSLTQVWSDGANWQFGHWLTGRASSAPLAETVAAILDDAGFADYDASGLTGIMQGYVVDRIGSVRDALQPLELAFFFDSIESGERIRFRHRGGKSAIALAEADLVEASPGAPRVSRKRSQETELPQAVKLTYIDPDKAYEQGAAEATRQTVRSRRIARAGVPIVMDYAQARDIAEAWLHETWVARETAAFTVPPSLFGLEPGDVIALEAGGRNHRLRITDVTLGEAISVEGTAVASAAALRRHGEMRPSALPEPIVYGEPVVAFLDLPAITGLETPFAARVAAFASPWPGGVAFYRSPSDAGFGLNAEADLPATIGETLADLSPGPTSRWDYGTRLHVRLLNGALVSLDEPQLLAGGNLVAIENADGEWELLQFRHAALTGENTYELKYLLRGQYGTEGAMRSPVAAGARFVLIDEAVFPALLTLDERGRTFNWRYGPAGLDIGHPAFRTVARAFPGISLRPLSPVHIRGRREGADLALSWVRRTRFGGDGWEAPDVPLNEEAELYEVDILDGSTVVRTIRAHGPSAIYAEAEQIADFGAPVAAVTIAVYQISASFGRGQGRFASVP